MYNFLHGKALNIPVALLSCSPVSKVSNPCCLGQNEATRRYRKIHKFKKMQYFIRKVSSMVLNSSPKLFISVERFIYYQ